MLLPPEMWFSVFLCCSFFTHGKPGKSEMAKKLPHPSWPITACKGGRMVEKADNMCDSVVQLGLHYWIRCVWIFLCYLNPGYRTLRGKVERKINHYLKLAVEVDFIRQKFLTLNSLYWFLMRSFSIKCLAVWMQKNNLEISLYFSGCLEVSAGILQKQIISLHPSSFPLHLPTRKVVLYLS